MSAQGMTDFPFKREIISLKKHQGQIENLRWQR